LELAVPLPIPIPIRKIGSPLLGSPGGDCTQKGPIFLVLSPPIPFRDSFRNTLYLLEGMGNKAVPKGTVKE